jgi:hypothetical protein
LEEDNPMLWLFVREAGQLSGESQLVALAGIYQAKSTDGTFWRFIFDSSGSERIRERLLDLDGLPDYNRLFFYGATCNSWAREDPAVLALLRPSACDPRLAWHGNPWCRTHQLMGLRLVQKNRCEPDEATAETITTVQNFILGELKWDFRVEDAYIQKVLVLVESGRRQDVKAIWIRRILDAQRPDGGWDGVDALAPWPGDQVLGWSTGSLCPRVLPRPTSNFHATAQALYLLGLLLEQSR